MLLCVHLPPLSTQSCTQDFPLRVEDICRIFPLLSFIFKVKYIEEMESERREAVFEDNWKEGGQTLLRY